MRSSWTLAAGFALLAASCGGGSSSGTTTGPLGSEPSSATSTAGDNPTTSVDESAAGVKVGQIGFTSLMEYERLHVSTAAEVTNVSDVSLGNIDWTAELLGADGAVLAEDSSTLTTVLAPGATTWIVRLFVLDEGAPEPAELLVTVASGEQWTVVPVANGEIPLDQAAIETLATTAALDINGEMHLEGEFHNLGDARLTSVSVACGVYVDGALAGGARGSINEMLPDGKAGFRTGSDLVTMTPLPDEVRCAASPVNISTFEPGGTGSGLEVRAGLTYNPAAPDGRFHDTIVGVTVFNPTDQAALGVRVEVDLLDAQGRFVELFQPSETYVLPGETLYTGGSSIVGLDSDPPAAVRTRVTLSGWADPTAASLGSIDGVDLTAYTFEVADASSYADTFTKFGGMVTNRSAADVSSAVISCAALLAGTPVGGGSWTLGDTVVAQPVPFEIITASRTMLSFDDVQCNVHLTSNSTVS